MLGQILCRSSRPRLRSAGFCRQQHYHHRLLQRTVIFASCQRNPPESNFCSSSKSWKSNSSTLFSRQHEQLSAILRLSFRRPLHKSPRSKDEDRRSKVETALELMKQDMRADQDKETAASSGVKLVKVGEEKRAEKKSLLVRAKAQLIHYYHGFRLLGLETKLSLRYGWRLLKGEQLTRKEKHQLKRTSSDLFKMVPFLMFVIVPMLEFALPLVLWLFPNMLPSTFQEKSAQRPKLRRQLRTRLEMAQFLQATVEEISLDRKKQATDQESASKAVEFAQFMKRIRSEGTYVSNAELLKYSHLFEDEFTLENLSLTSLRALCRIVSIQPLGTPNVLRFQLYLKLRSLKADDRLIVAEGGVDKLTVEELQQASRDRGMRALGLSEERLRSQMRQWIELSMNDKVPPTLLLLSRTLYLPEEVSFTDRLKRIVGDLPDNIEEHTRLILHEFEGGKTDYKAQWDLVRAIEKALDEERAQIEKAKVEEKKKQKKEEEEEQARIAAAEAAQVEAAAAPEEPEEKQEPISIDPAPILTVDSGVAEASPEVLKGVGVKEKEKAEFHSSELQAVEQLISEAAGQFHEEKMDLEELEVNIEEHKKEFDEVVDVASTTGANVNMTSVGRRLEKRVAKMVSRVHSLLTKLQKERDSLKLSGEPATDTDAEPSAKDEKRRLKIVTVDETLKVLSRLQQVEDESNIQRITQILNALDDDHDGNINVDLALEVVDILGKENVKIDSAQMGKVLELLHKEDRLDEENSSNSSKSDATDDSGTSTSTTNKSS